MKLLLDENLPKKLKYRFSDAHEVLTVPEMGWSGIKNGDLLKRMQDKGLEILLSLDKNMSHQHNLQKYNVSFWCLTQKTPDTILSYLLLRKLNAYWSPGFL